MTRIKLNKTLTFILSAFVAASVPGFAQVELSGSWGARNHEDAGDKANGPLLVDFTGIPLNEAGRARSLSYSMSQLSMPERMCLFYPAYYLLMGPFGLSISNETDPVTGNTIALKIGSWEDRAPTTIWMDGRPHPSKYAPHEKSGFTTGVWEGDVLTAYTTHMKSGFYKRNAATGSDQTTMTTHFVRHGDLLTVTGLVEDPIYLEAPMYWSRTFQWQQAPINPVGPPCIRGDEGLRERVVPHYLPGKNPFINEVTAAMGIPVEAVLGGAETVYPEFRKKIKDKFVPPGKCERNCGGIQPAQ